MGSVFGVKGERDRERSAELCKTTLNREKKKSLSKKKKKKREGDRLTVDERSSLFCGCRLPCLLAIPLLF